MASEQEVVLWCNCESVASEDGGVDGEGGGHATGDAGGEVSRDIRWRCRSRETYNSGSFCVSITAAMGMPKLDAGPQKSVNWGPLSACFHAYSLFAFRVFDLCILLLLLFGQFPFLLRHSNLIENITQDCKRIVSQARSYDSSDAQGRLEGGLRVEQK